MEKPRIDPEFEEVTEGVEDELKGKLKTKWARMEQLVGTHLKCLLALACATL